MDQLTMYTTTWCGFCRRLKLQMDQAGIDYREIDIEHDREAAQRVEALNGGNRTVPTLVFPDGTATTNPRFTEVEAKLADPAA